MAIHLWDYAPDALEVSMSELLVATAEGADDLIDQNVKEVLHGLREHLKMDVIFVSEIRNGQRTFKHVDHSADKALIETGGGSSLEQSFCQCVLDGRLPPLVHDAAQYTESAKLPATPFRVGAHLSTPIILADGQIYGTLCCFSTEPDPSLRDTDLQKLAVVAKHTAKRIDVRRETEREAELEKWKLQPLEEKKQGWQFPDKKGN
ncbi:MULTISPECIES: GAF domain-containing protein [Comamonas]|jgi:transcriptional regulator with GAF, ATPase, and Fis domain|uniref:GAF domain-containing protein n=2 Tax=Comamonas sediminis TaxID=1783360 RepID=A0ABV4B006_9BURK|nr:MULTISPECIES: GAF domain-containing protein [unclassified Comamonas]ULR90775.1 GAF domain-containing protein [Comamonas sp. B21-038]